MTLLHKNTIKLEELESLITTAITPIVKKGPSDLDEGLTQWVIDINKAMGDVLLKTPVRYFPKYKFVPRVVNGATEAAIIIPPTELMNCYLSQAQEQFDEESDNELGLPTDDYDDGN